MRIQPMFCKIFSARSRFTGSGACGHWQLVGTAEQIVDALEDRYVNCGADGYNVMPALLPGSLDDFIALVLPELRRRGLFRSEYEGRTLRENLGLRRPVSRYSRYPHETASA
ncbi:hypothetical protein LMG28727_05892 [Paraburkholderia kirstenboschensis]|nr:hypothetical protein LMG28727_05892 [Paraburkholderia kirstenboschensis]